MFIPDCCANCDAALEMANQTLFCGEFCRQVADFVRYSRGVTRDPARANDPEVMEAIRVRMAILIGGGYPAGDRHLSPEQRASIIDRDGGNASNAVPRQRKLIISRGAPLTRPTCSCCATTATWPRQSVLSCRPPRRCGPYQSFRARTPIHRVAR
jgi:hypothetical protein